MKKLFVTVCVLVLAAAMVAPASAQSKIALNIGGDVLLPLGTFADVQSVGFGGDVTGEYTVMPELNLTATLGYFTWGGKDFSEGGVTLAGASFHSIPFMVGAKYYFMPANANLRVYGAAQLGLFFSGTTVKFGGTPPVVVGGVTIFPGTPAREETVSSSDFVFAPVVGIEAPVSPTGKIDAAVKFYIISGSTNLGIRVGYKFGI